MQVQLFRKSGLTQTCRDSYITLITAAIYNYSIPVISYSIVSTIVGVFWVVCPRSHGLNVIS